MDSERWQRARGLFESALEREPIEWNAWLDQACADDHQLRREVRALLDAHRAAGEFLEPSAAGAATEAAPPAGDMVGLELAGRYRITGQVGQGGMGVVYRAHDPLLGRDVAVKMIPPANLRPETEERFHREAQVVAGMDHPAIVSIHDFGDHEGSIFFVMPLVEGTTLRQLIHDKTLSLGETLSILAQVAEALDYSHAHGVVHRDIKPANVMVARDHEGGEPRVRVMDFGVAHGGSGTRLTRTGGIVGTLAYLSPEQISSGAVDGRADLYAVGAVLYECLTGQPPFSGSVYALIYRILHERPMPLRAHGVDIDEELEATVLACLAKDPAGRPPRGRDLAQALGRHERALAGSDRGRTPVLSALSRLLGGRLPSTPMVGRQHELAVLQRQLDAALEGECRLALIGGDVGLGKTRLIQEVEKLAHMRRVRVLRGRLSNRDSTFPYHGLCELIQDYFRPRDGGSPSASTLQGQGTPDLSDLAADLLSLFPVLSELPELRSAAPESTAQPSPPAAGDSTRVFELLARTLTRLGGGEPMVLLLENLHIGDISVEALQYIVHRLGPTPTLIVGSYRPGEIDRVHPLSRMVEGFHDDARFRSLILEPLEPDAFRALVERQIGSTTLRDDLLNRLYEATEGNPLFGQELISSLLETGGVARDESGSWSLAWEPGLFADAMPATIQQAVERRLERLAPARLEVLSVAAVLGKHFDYRDLEPLIDVDDLDDAIDDLVRHGFLIEDRKGRGDRLSFASGLVCDILYGEVPRRRRRALHRKHARALERRYAGRHERVYPQLVHHFSEGDVPDKTVSYACALGRQALAAYGPEDAVRAVKVALEFVEEDEIDDAASAEGELREILAGAQRALGNVGRAVREAERATEAFVRAGATERAAGAALLAAETAWQGRRVGAARWWVDRGIELARGDAAPGVRHRLLTLGATVANLRGAYRQAQAYLEQAEELDAAAGAAAAEVPPPAGGTLVAAMPQAVASLDPAELAGDEELELAAVLYDTLLTSDAAGHPMPSLCQRWQGSDDGRSFVLSLRTDVRFSDGTLLTAATVKAALERTARRAGEPPAAFERLVGFEAFRAGEAASIAGIEVRGEHVVELRLTEPLPIFPALLTVPTTAIARAVGEQGTAALVGTGAFRLAEQDRQRVRLERNPNDWRAEPALLDAIEFRVFPDAFEIAAGLRAGTIDLGRDLLPEDLDEILRAARFRAGLVEATRQNVYFALFNAAGPVTAEPRVRRALAGVVRTQDLVWRTLGRFAQPAMGLIPPGILGHDPGRRRGTLSRERAAELLREAGLEPPIRLHAAIHPLLQERYGSLTAALLDEWSALGVEVYFEMTSMDTFRRALRDPEVLDVVISRWSADYDDPDNFTYGLFHGKRGRFRRFFAAADVDRLLERARQERDGRARQLSYRKLERLLDERCTLVPLFHDVNYRLAGPAVSGLTLGNKPPYVDYAALGKKTAAPEAEAESAAAVGAEIQVPLTVAVERLDPCAGASAEAHEVLPCVFETLTRIDDGARVVPWLAEAVEPLPGGRGYRVQLRAKLRFHDGRRVTARDVRYAFERVLRSPHADYHALLLPIVGARALRDGNASDLPGLRIESATELVFELDEPQSFFPAVLSHPALAVVPEGERRFSRSWREGCVGTGPFRVVRFVAGGRLDLEKNPQYWRPGVPGSERLVFHFGVTPQRIASDFRAGRLSLASDLRPAEIADLRRDPRFVGAYREAPRLATFFLAMNVHRGPLADPIARRALAQAIGVDELLRETVDRQVSRAHGLIPPGLPGHEAPPERSEHGSDIHQPVLRGLRLHAAVHPVFAGAYAPVWRRLCERLVPHGVGLDASYGPVRETLALKGESIDLICMRWIAGYPDADAFAALLERAGGLLGALCGGPALDRLVTRGRTEVDPALRHATYRELEELLAQDVRLVPLFHEQSYRFCQPGLAGLRLGLTVPQVRYEELHAAR